MVTKRTAAAAGCRAVFCVLILSFSVATASAQAPLASGSYTISCSWQSDAPRVCAQSAGTPRGARIVRVTLTALDYDRQHAAVYGVSVEYGIGDQRLQRASVTQSISTTDAFAGYPAAAAGRDWYLD